jgi:RND family efflux transporter MFP subunit
VGSGGVLSASGYVTARRLATVSAEITGRIAEVLIEEGMEVQAGQVLARLDTSLAKTEVGGAEGNLKSARGGLAAAQADNAEAARILERVRGVRAKEFASVADITRAEANAKTAAARLTQAEGNLKSAENALARARALLDKHEIRAPFGGMVTTKDAQPGEIVSPAAAGGGFTRTGICTIVDMNSLEVEVEVNESFISRVKPGQRATATLDAYPDWEIPAKVAAIIPTANRDKATVKVRVALETRDPRILPEMAAKVLFFDEEKKEAAPAPASTPSPGTP